jgi:uncharacterized protein (TIGR00725 family)
MQKIVVGVMGASETDALTPATKAEAGSLAERLGAALARAGVVLVTGATTGLPNLIAAAYHARGGALVLGISPAATRNEHAERYRLPSDAADVIVYTGFGLKGRNVINVRTADIVIIFGGATGTLNEFTIAYDEAKVIGVLEGSGGIADHIRDVIEFCKKPCSGTVLFDRDPDALLDRCLTALEQRRNSRGSPAETDGS